MRVGDEYRQKTSAQTCSPHLHGFMADVDAAFEHRSSTFRSESGKRMYIMTTSRITPGEELKHRDEEGLNS